jgi:serine/threonine-protein kinase
MPANWASPTFAPDGRRLALDISDGKQSNVWIDDWAHDALSRLTVGPADDRNPVWTPDGRRIAFASTRGDQSTENLYWQRADGTGEVQRLTESQNNQFPESWYPDGKLLLFSEKNPQTDWDLMILSIAGGDVSGWTPGKPTPLLNGPFAEEGGVFSPDGRWLAYLSNESGQAEVYVRPFPSPGGKWQISAGGGENPHWSRARHELFYSTPDLRIMVAPYSVEGDGFRVDVPRLWSEGHFMPRPRPPNADWDLHPDGTRVAIAPVQQDHTTTQNKVVFVFQFFDELRRVAPIRK